MEKGIMMDEAFDIRCYLKEQFAVKEVDIKTYSPLTLAYIGDSVYDFIIKSLVVFQGNTSPNKLHSRTSYFVKAKTQAAMAEAIMEQLSEEEYKIYKRGRNAKPYTKAKNATMETYLEATGLEALIGYLYLLGRQQRMIDLVKQGMDLMGESI